MTEEMNNILYLKPWDYNKSLILDKIEVLVEEKGGKLTGYYKPGKIVGRDGKAEAVQTNHCDVFGSYVSFVLDNTYYYLELDDNPFFEFHFHKIPVVNGVCKGKYFVDEFPKKDFPNTLYSYSETDLDEVAKNVFATILSMPNSRIYQSEGKTEIKERRAISC